MTVLEINRHIEAESRLSETLGQYAGRWVAVSDHSVVAVADTAEELLEATRSIPVDRRFLVAAAAGRNLLPRRSG